MSATLRETSRESNDRADYKRRQASRKRWVCGAGLLCGLTVVLYAILRLVLCGYPEAGIALGIVGLYMLVYLCRERRN